MEKLTDQMRAALRADPAAPPEYISWLENHGWGEIGSARYMLYSGPVPLNEISPGAPSGYLAFGDDFAGNNGCFKRVGAASVYEWVSATNERRDTNRDFVSFIRVYGAEG